MTENTISLKLVPIVALGFASTQLTWTFFNIFVPVVLKDEFGFSLGLVGFIMTWDNIIAFFVQPYIGSRSDRTKTRIGRRYPYIIPGIIFAAGLFFLMAYTKELPLYLFLLNILVFNLFMAIYRSPSVSLMPDLIKSKDRSIGNGIVNLIGGAAGGISLFVGGSMLEVGNTLGAFTFISSGMIIFLLILLIFIREPDYSQREIIEEEKDSIFRQLSNEFKRIVRAEEKSMLFMLLAILTWFIAWNAIEAFYSIYVWKQYLPEMDREEAAGVAGTVLFVFPVIFVIFTLVGGVLGSKIGRIKTMKIGLLIMTFAIFLGSLVNEDAFLNQTINWQTSFKLIFVIAAIGWGLVNVNSIVVIWEHSVDNGIGTGMYYAFSSAAAILGPTIAGILMQQIHIKALFPFSIFFLVVSFLLLLKVKSGEAGDHEAIVGKAIGELVD